MMEMKKMAAVSVGTVTTMQSREQRKRIPGRWFGRLQLQLVCNIIMIIMTD
jgi:hypothetical protein